MQCEETQLDITAYLHGGLPPDRRAEVESHLAACQACSEEATAMQNLSSVLSRGLKDWVDEGVCPHDLMATIEASLRPTRQRAWWQGWPAYAGAVAAVFLVLVIVASQTADMSHQVASIPFVGGLAAHLLYPASDVKVDDLAGDRPAQVAGAADHDGIKLEVYLPTLGTDRLRVQFSLKGPGLDTQANINRYSAALVGAHGALKLRSLRIERAADEVLLLADYDPILPGQSVTLSVRDLPVAKQAAALPAGTEWQVTVKP